MSLEISESPDENLASGRYIEDHGIWMKKMEVIASVQNTRFPVGQHYDTVCPLDINSLDTPDLGFKVVTQDGICVVYKKGHCINLLAQVYMIFHHRLSF